MNPPPLAGSPHRHFLAAALECFYTSLSVLELGRSIRDAFASRPPPNLARWVVADSAAGLPGGFDVISAPAGIGAGPLEAAWRLLQPRGILMQEAPAPGGPGPFPDGHRLVFKVDPVDAACGLEAAFHSRTAPVLALLAGRLSLLRKGDPRMACDPAVEAVLRSDPERGLRSGRVPARLYAGDVPEFVEYLGWTGLSLTQRNHRHIQHDLTRPLPFPDASVAAFQAEDVLEHIGYADLPPVLAEIHRVLKPGGRFRLSVPDYGCDVLRERTWMDAAGNLLFDPDGGGTPAEPGHLWFPRIDSVRALVDRGPFARSDFLHYWNLDDATFVLRPIDHDLGFVLRTPDFDDRVRHPPRPMSLVVDLIKGS